MDKPLRHFFFATVLFAGLLIASGCKTATRPEAETGYIYTVQPGDTVEAIAAAFRDKHVEVTREQIVRANPQVKFLEASGEQTVAVGERLFVPCPRR